MEFVINCPVDGHVEVSLEDIDTVVLKEPEQAEVVFSCPECGTRISVAVRIPSFLMTAMETMARDSDSFVVPLASLVVLAAEADARQHARKSAHVSVTSDAEQEDEKRIDAYCEYFRRQLADIDCVGDMLREF